MIKATPWTLNEKETKVSNETITVRDVVYAKIEVLLEMMNMNSKNISDILDYISSKFDSSSISSVKVSKKSPVAKKQYFESILSLLSNNENMMYDLESISKKAGVPIRSLRRCIQQLKNARKIKVVGWNIGSHGPAKLSYQLWKSPLKAVKFVTQKQGYDSINSFVKNYRKLAGRAMSPMWFTKKVEEEGLTVYPLTLDIGVVKGYKVSELLKLAQRLDKNSVSSKKVSGMISSKNNSLGILNRIFGKAKVNK